VKLYYVSQFTHIKTICCAGYYLGTPLMTRRSLQQHSGFALFFCLACPNFTNIAVAIFARLNCFVNLQAINNRFTD